MFDIERQDGETEEQLLCRIGRQKDENNLTWQNIADIMNRLLDYNSPSYRAWLAMPLALLSSFPSI